MRLSVINPRRPDSALLLLPVVVLLALVSWLGLRAPLYAAAIIYVVGFLVVVWRHPHVALLLILATAPFQNDLSGGGPFKFSAAEVNLLLAFIILLLQMMVRRQAFTLGPIALPVALYFGVCLFSSAQHWRGGTAVASLLQMAIYMVVAVLVFSISIRQCRDPLMPLYGPVLVGVVLAGIALITRSNFFLGLHKNGIGASLASAAVIAAELWFAASDPRRKRVLGIAFTLIVAGLVITLSRGAWLAALVGFFTVVLFRGQHRLLFKTSLLLVPIVALGWMLLPAESREVATDLRIAPHTSLNARLESIDIARSYFQANPLYGVGVGLRKEYDSTNVLWVTLAETGVLGLGSFLLIQGVLLRSMIAARNRLSRSDPRFSFVSLAAGLILGKLLHGCLDHYWSRGPLMIAWGVVGLALYPLLSHRFSYRSVGAGLQEEQGTVS